MRSFRVKCSFRDGLPTSWSGTTDCACVLGGVLSLYTSNPTAARVYEEAGFVRLEPQIEAGSAWQE